MTITRKQWSELLKCSEKINSVLHMIKNIVAELETDKIILKANGRIINILNDILESNLKENSNGTK